MKTIRLIANTMGMEEKVIDNISVKVDLYPKRSNLIKSCWRVFKASKDYDFIVINCDIKLLLVQSIIRYIPINKQCKLVSVDALLQEPLTFIEKFEAIIKSLILKNVDIFIEYFKDTSGYEKNYCIKKEKFRYVPFKINCYEEVLKKISAGHISDEGYIFCGGNTKRDFNTLIAAARVLDFPFLIVTMENSVLKHHGSHLMEENLPQNITVIRHDGSSSFLDYIAKARLVALPLKKLTISATGIGVYITCMSLNKCVIISSSPSVKDIIKDEAIIVPAEDEKALIHAIKKAYNNKRVRDDIAKRGQQYALSLKGEERLYESIISELIEEIIDV